MSWRRAGLSRNSRVRQESPAGCLAMDNQQAYQLLNFSPVLECEELRPQPTPEAASLRRPLTLHVRS